MNGCVGTHTNTPHSLKQTQRESDLCFHWPTPMQSHLPAHPCALCSWTPSNGIWELGWEVLRWLALICCNWVGAVKKINCSDWYCVPDNPEVKNSWPLLCVSVNFPISENYQFYTLNLTERYCSCSDVTKYSTIHKNCEKSNSVKWIKLSEDYLTILTQML